MDEMEKRLLTTIFVMCPWCVALGSELQLQASTWDWMWSNDMRVKRCPHVSPGLYVACPEPNRRPE